MMTKKELRAAVTRLIEDVGREPVVVGITPTGGTFRNTVAAQIAGREAPGQIQILAAYMWKVSPPGEPERYENEVRVLPLATLARSDFGWDGRGPDGERYSFETPILGADPAETRKAKLYKSDPYPKGSRFAIEGALVGFEEIPR